MIMKDPVERYPCLGEVVKGKDEEQTRLLLAFRARVKAFERRCWQSRDPSVSDDDHSAEIRRDIHQLQSELPLSATKAQKCYWTARLLNQLPETRDQAFFFAQKALRMNAFMVDAWIEMAKILWERQETTKAALCIKEAFELEVSPKTQAFMSLTMRFNALQTVDKSQKEQLLRRSVELAKAAVLDHHNYAFGNYCLGMSYFYSFFAADYKCDFILKQALTVLENTASGVDPFYRGDLHANMAQAYIYIQKYSTAIQQLRIAEAMDPDIYTGKTNVLIEYLTFLAIELQKYKKNYRKPSNNSSLLTQATKAAQSIWRHRDPVEQDISHLGESTSSWVALQVLGQIQTDCLVPLSFVVADNSGSVIILSLYNVGSQFRLLVNDIVCLFAPDVINVTEHIPSPLILLRCVDPLKNFLRNGRHIELAEIQTTSISVNA